jgi:uncharacterized membrane protein required for colicin V production
MDGTILIVIGIVALGAWRGHGQGARRELTNLALVCLALALAALYQPSLAAWARDRGLPSDLADGIAFLYIFGVVYLLVGRILVHVLAWMAGRPWDPRLPARGGAGLGALRGLVLAGVALAGTVSFPEEATAAAAERLLLGTILVGYLAVLLTPRQVREHIVEEVRRCLRPST